MTIQFGCCYNYAPVSNSFVLYGFIFIYLFHFNKRSEEFFPLYIDRIKLETHLVSFDVKKWIHYLIFSKLSLEG